MFSDLRKQVKNVFNKNHSFIYFNLGNSDLI